MQLMNTFTVSAPVERTWAAVTDQSLLAGCLPDSFVTGNVGGGSTFDWSSGVRIGPIDAQFEGTARLLDRDDARQHAVLRAHGRDVHGRGDAEATVDLQLRSSGSGSEVVIGTDLQLTGRVARVGRGVVAGVGANLVGQFAQRLDAQLSADTSRPPSEPPVPVDNHDDAMPPTTDSIEPSAPVGEQDHRVRPNTEEPAGGVLVSRLGFVLAAATGALGLIVGVLLGRRSARAVRSGPNR